MGYQQEIDVSDGTDQTVVLNGGHRVGFAEYGCPDGAPVVFCHGLPSSRLEGKLFRRAAEKNDVRLIVPDRPGYGLSQPCRLFSVACWPEEVSDLMNSLGIERFSIFGNSGGGPYALACAAKLPDRLEQIGIVCALGPVDQSWARADMHWTGRFSFLLGRHIPFLLRLIYSDLTAALMCQHPERSQAWLRHGSPAADAKVLNRPEIAKILTDAWLEGLREGSSGAVGDLTRNASDWGFDISDISSKVHVWHGTADRVVPVSHGHYYAESLPNVEARFVEDEGHFSLPVNYGDDILRVLSGIR